MVRSAFTGGLFPTLLNHVGPLQGAWGHWGALIRLHGVSGCCQRPSRPTRSTVAVSVPYWGRTAAVCLLVDGMTHLRLPTRPPLPPPAHPSPLPPTPPPSRPPLPPPAHPSTLPPTHPPLPPTPPPPTHPSPLPPTHPPPINSIRDITAVGKKLSQNPAVSARW